MQKVEIIFLPFATKRLPRHFRLSKPTIALIFLSLLFVLILSASFTINGVTDLYHQWQITNLNNNHQNLVASLTDIKRQAFSYNQSTNSEDDKSINNHDIIFEQTIYQPGINLVIGLNYVFKEHFVIGAELLPHFSYITGKSTRSSYRYNDDIESDISGFSYGLSNSSALISLSYRF